QQGRTMQLTAQIHQPSMKVFTVGMDDKGLKVDAPEKSEKAAPVVVPVPQSPILLASQPPAPKYRRSFKGLFTCFGLLIFALIVAITISEIAYHRQRDEAFFRLKWAELKQRMLGYDLMRAQMQQQQAQQAQQLQQQHALPLLQQGDDATAERPAVVDERLAFSNRLKSGDRVTTTTTEPSSSEQQDDTVPIDVRFAFLRAILQKMRERAVAAGMDGKMHVSLIEVRRPEFNDENNNNNINDNVHDLSPDSDAFQDGFGEVAAPHPLTGHFRIGGVRPNIDESNDRMPASDFFGPRWEHPSQFLPEPVRPWNSFPRGGDADSAFFPRPWEQPSSDDEEPRHPHMRVTHHFDRDGGPSPNRVVTELFGQAGQQALDNMLLRGAPMMQLQQMQQAQQMQQMQPQMGMDSPGSSFPRWEATINDLPRPWLHNQMPPQPGMMPQADFPMQQMQQMQQPNIWSMQPAPMNGPYTGAGNFWSIPPVQQPQPPAFPMQQPQNDDVTSNWGSQMGQQLGSNIGTHFRDQEQAAPKLPFGTQELPQNDVVDVRPLPAAANSEQSLQQLPWYVPHGFEHQRPAWAADHEKAANDDVPMIFPHPTAAERPIDAPAAEESTNKTLIARMKATQTDSDVSSFLHEGEVQPPRWAASTWQRTQPAAAVADSAPESAPSVDAARARLPERDSFDDVPPAPSNDDPSGPANDDIDPSRVLFQVDEPHLAP
ncbi:hypothetical protein PFISCL1PPCAC_6628, partial [Pristionchus fissidentatus]